MGRITPPTSFSSSRAATVREWFALTQADLASWLEVTARHVEAVEAGRRQFSPAVERRLSQLADMWMTTRLLGPDGQPRSEALPLPPPLPPPPPPAYQVADEASELRRRQRRCEHLAYNLRYQLENIALQDAALLRRRQGLAVLRQALATPGSVFDPGFVPAEAEKWLERLEAATAAVPRPGPLARAHLVLRERLLREEAEELEKLLTAETTSAG
ncbi:hypothetical protein [Hymenobacter cellulosivorans]|uniref:XRE family transcriptional regulator n=1 Tax=Hymenobacter cellulosivorans TaxID=2932249 RepID=A0ABY4F586_9BACT|nr:hypothetical protein [Hymenobacter cellulosivorans]UOQ51832.1 hypothetical protein MUN80_18965 [Hymenobacter cellulosivorans]